MTRLGSPIPMIHLTLHKRNSFTYFGSSRTLRIKASFLTLLGRCRNLYVVSGLLFVCLSISFFMLEESVVNIQALCFFGGFVDLIFTAVKVVRVVDGFYITGNNFRIIL